MRYFEHHTDANEDPDMVYLLGQHGAAGYGVFWIIGEIIGHQVRSPDDPPEVRMLTATWARRCGVSMKKFHQIISTLNNQGKIELDLDGRFMTIRHDKILKYCDQWMKKLRRCSGSTPAALRPNSAKIRLKEIKVLNPPTPLAAAPSGGAPAAGGNGEDQNPPKDTPEQFAAGRAALKAANLQLGMMTIGPPPGGRRDPAGTKF
jgi:hypothetical protein